MGVSLFTANLVREATDNASKLNINLSTRWGMQEKRKFSEGSGPQPKNKKFKKGSFRAPKAQQAIIPMTVPLAQDSSSAQGSGGQQYMFVPGPQQSPVFNPMYEGQTMCGGLCTS